MLARADAAALERVIADGGLAVIPTDTVYGLACDPDAPAAVARLHALKRRPADKPAAVLFFSLDAGLGALPELGTRTREVLTRLLPGGLTALVPNPARRFAAACGPDPQTLGLRVPALTPALAALRAVRRPLAQSSANLAGGADPRSLDDVDPAILAAAQLVLDAGPLPGTASTVLDLRTFEDGGGWSVLREGAVARAALAPLLGST